MKGNSLELKAWCSQESLTDEDRQKFDFDIQAVHWPSYLKVYAQVSQFLPIVSTLCVIVSFRVSETSYSKRTLPPRPLVEGVFKLQKKLILTSSQFVYCHPWSLNIYSTFNIPQIPRKLTFLWFLDWLVKGGFVLLIMWTIVKCFL